MKGFNINTITLLGEQTLTKQLEIMKRWPWHQKTVFNKIWKMDLAGSPKQAIFLFRDPSLGSLIDPHDFTIVMIRELEIAGAVLNIDYKIEVY
jgi:hypothetical protein